eukprot:CAMPEP_0197195398 /NCGR_PEP_ID=MMETSP1423-20130617/31043_1 /TAXON_ID=476441 /ORGANISM="Pseudo-nitzschia heimii, Strain UNC1101" /LENGTH=413 /DNA_ID=CAMNT_0042649027 /DNA_START=82 /DNA_END=1323 /DNA_ORIENTATION=-
MGLVKLLKCEKKLEDLPDKIYETENDSDSVSSSCKRDREQRKTKHRWYHLFKSNKKVNNAILKSTVTDYRRNLAQFPANLNNDNENKRTINLDGEIPLETDNPQNDRASARPKKAIVIESSRNIPEEYWQNKILSRFSADQRDLLAESLFSHIWKTQGEGLATKLIKEYDTENIDRIAEDHFERGCRLWAEEDTEGAHSEFERSRRIKEVQAKGKSLLYHQCIQQNEVGNAEHSTAESDAELFFALGMVQSGRQEYHYSLKEFRRALQVAALGLGMEHELTKASAYMIRSVQLNMGLEPHEIQKNVSQLTIDIQNEIEGDQLYETGEKDQALVEYANLNLLYDSDSLVQSRIITKMATIFEEKNDYVKAMDLWTDLLVLYEDTPSLGLQHPLAQYAFTKIVIARRKIQPWSEI